MKRIALILFLSVPCVVYATPRRISYDTVAANPKDVSSLDDIIGALYQVISGGAGQKRDWDRMRSLFLPSARLISTGRKQDGTISKREMMLEDYIAQAGPFLEKNGFFEKEVSRKAEVYSSVAQLFSTYESRHLNTDEKPFVRGINSIQLYADGKRWWIVNIIWASESKESQIPGEFLKP